MNKHRIIKTLNFFIISFTKNENRFLSLAYGYRNDDIVIGKFDANGVSVFSFMVLPTEYSP